MTNEIPQTGPDVRALSVSKYLVPAIFACLVILPVLYYGLNSELARWKAARAELHYERAEFGQSIAIMEQAVQQAPHNQTLRLNLATKLMAHDRAGDALEIIDSVVPLSTDKRPAIEAKSECLMYLGRTEQALQTYKQTLGYLAPEEFDGPLRLNQLAYYRALAGKELKDATDNIISSVEILKKSFWELDEPPMSLEDQILVATTMIARQVDQSERVLPLLNERIQRMESMIQTTQQEISNRSYEMMVNEFPLSKKQRQDIQVLRFSINMQGRFLALLLSVRALVHQDHHHDTDCDLDRLHVEKLNHDAEKLISQLPDDWFLMYVMATGAQVLDTHAMVNQAKGADLRQSIKKLNVAILALDILRETSDGSLQNTIRDERGISFPASRLIREQAVLRKHRAEINLRIGQVEDSRLDFQWIRELGIDPDKFIF